MSATLSALQIRLKHQFSKPWLLTQALTHRSYAAEHNERFEFLGDTILNLAITHLLFERYPATSEGDLSRSRATLVRQETLHSIAQTLELSTYMRLGDGELKSSGLTRPSMMADTVEALLGAVFLDSDYNTAATVIAHLYQPLFANFEPGSKQKDSKSLLQEVLQGAKLPLASYTLLTVQGAAHQQAFEILCRVDAWNVQAIGIGSSRKIAEQAAAIQVLAQQPLHRPSKSKKTPKTP